MKHDDDKYTYLLPRADSEDHRLPFKLLTRFLACRRVE